MGVLLFRLLFSKEMQVHQCGKGGLHCFHFDTCHFFLTCFFCFLFNFGFGTFCVHALSASQVSWLCTRVTVRGVKSHFPKHLIEL